MENNNWLKGSLILGLSFFLAVFLVKPIGVSTQFSVLSGMIHSSIDKDLIVEDQERESGYKSTNEYYDKSEGKLAKSIKDPLNYDFIFVLAIPVGGLLGYFMFRKKIEKAGACQNDITECPLDNHKKGFLKTYAPSFLAGALLLYGARMADGCTSGHMMSGMMQGSVSGYAFAVAVFLTAIPTALLVKKMKKAK